ncbi:MAG: sialate O-acetylesterase [Bacilli bacterium]|jgi:hypothetical protein
MKKDTKVLILLGQSNMEGHSWTSYLLRHYNNDKIELYNAGLPVDIAFSCDFGTNNSNYEFITVKTGLGYNEDRFGPEIGIAEHLISVNRNNEFKIIKYAVGGTTLKNFWRSPSSGAPGECYARAIPFIHTMLKKLVASGYNPKVSAILFMQGESDACEGYHNEYEKLLFNFVKDLRHEFKAYAPKNGIYFIDALIKDQEIWTEHKIVNNAKRNLVKKLDNIVIVDTIAANLTVNNEPDGEPDLAHYDSDATIKLGHLFGEAITKHIK